ncbi:hypothetical protein GH714_012244 [Hevea brasiliensis]|uniref:Uncharacterized protein n=1 Tax=Hevea brasiliensis TaxID=3981 RepID=A0A6A6N4A9_HEVBR|nr:hypothetical protein GH714_012244 [Hevea brasiliensis]
MEQSSSNPASATTPHVLIFPCPAQGHVNSMLKLAELLSLAGLKLFFLNTNRIQERLTHFADVEARFAKYPGFQFITIPDCLPEDYQQKRNKLEVIKSLEVKSKPILKRLLIETRPPPARTSYKSDTTDPYLLMMVNEAMQSPRAQALILNTFEDLEAPILSEIRNHRPKTYTIEPLHKLLKTKHRSIKTQESSYQSLNSLWEVDRSCITWLDTQPSQSVLYISVNN